MVSTDSLSLRDAAAALGLSMATVRSYVKAGRLKATKERGKFGAEYRIRPAVLSAFAAEALGLEVDLDALRAPQGSPGQTTGSPAEASEDVVALYERLVTATEEAARFKAIAEISESTKREAEEAYQAMLAAVRAERDTAQAKADAAAQEAAEAAAELAKLRSRGWWSRLWSAG